MSLLDPGPHVSMKTIQARRDRRKAERRWRASGLQADFVVFKAKRNYVIHLTNEARRTHYKEFIDASSSDQSKLFRASKSLLNLQADKSLPPHTDVSVLANEMGEYFIHRIVAFRSKLAGDTVSLAVIERAPGLQLISKNFRPVSNLQFTFKLTEKAVAVQLQEQMLVNGLFPELQSAYRQHHSTETALLKVKNDLLMAMDKGQVTLLVLLDLRSAFDTVEHEMLLERLRSTIGLRGKVL